MCPSVPSGRGQAVSRIPDSTPNMRSIPASVGTWHDPDLGRPIAAPLDRCAELLGVDLATAQELAANVEPYIRVDGTKVWSLTQLERQLRPRRTAGAEAATSTADEPRPTMHESCASRENHPAHPLRTTVVRPSPSSWWDST